jgi:hypothetical protein
VERRAFLGASAAAVACWLWPERAGASVPLVLVPIVAASSAVADVSLGTLRRVFLSQPVSGPGGVAFVGFNQPAGTRERELFDRVVLGMSPDEAARYWVDQRIRSGLRPPRSVPNVALLRQVVVRYPGAIGYVAVGDLDATVKPVTINGAGPAAPSYPLR